MVSLGHTLRRPWSQSVSSAKLHAQLERFDKTQILTHLHETKFGRNNMDSLPQGVERVVGKLAVLLMQLEAIWASRRIRRGNKDVYWRSAKLRLGHISRLEFVDRSQAITY